jgi:hypothetical protein
LTGRAAAGLIGLLRCGLGEGRRGQKWIIENTGW